MSGLSVIAISSILDKASTTTDSDYRFMAVKDLHNELSKGSATVTAAGAAAAGSTPGAGATLLEPETERRITQILLGFIASITHSAELQELASKWYDRTAPPTLRDRSNFPLRSILTDAVCTSAVVDYSLPHLVVCCSPTSVETLSAHFCQQLLTEDKFSSSDDLTEQRAASAKRRSRLGTALQSIIGAIRPSALSAAGAAAAATAAASGGAVATSGGSTLLFNAVVTHIQPPLLQALVQRVWAWL